MPSEKRVVIVGAGLNGLTAAAYLAKAGYKPLVLERREMIGGIAAIEEIHPGFRCPSVVHAVPALLPHIVKDLNLQKHGLQCSARDGTIMALHPHGRALHVSQDPNYRRFDLFLRRIARALKHLVAITAPDIDKLNLDDYLNSAKFGLKFRGLNRSDAFRLLRYGPMPVADLVSEWFQDDLLQAVVAAQGIFGTFAGPRSAGTSIGVLMRAVADEAFAVSSGHALADVLAKATVAGGGQIRTNARVANIQVKDTEPVSVVLESGEEIRTKTVVSSADPKRTLLQFIDPGVLDPGFLNKVQSFRAMGTVAKVNFALSALPAFTGLQEQTLAKHVHIGHSIDYLEQAFDAAKYGEFSARPYLDITVPSLVDPSIAPKGAHVMSVHVQYAPYRLKNGDWNAKREELADSVVRVLVEYAPNIRDRIVARQVITPLDLEQKYSLTGGHIFHGEHALDQLFAFRPILGYAQYRTPINGLYLCGAGTHPGGFFAGAAGANAAREIVRDLKSKS